MIDKITTLRLTAAMAPISTLCQQFRLPFLQDRHSLLPHPPCQTLPCHSLSQSLAILPCQMHPKTTPSLLKPRHGLRNHVHLKNPTIPQPNNPNPTNSRPNHRPPRSPTSKSPASSYHSTRHNHPPPPHPPRLNNLNHPLALPHQPRNIPLHPLQRQVTINRVNPRHHPSNKIARAEVVIRYATRRLLMRRWRRWRSVWSSWRCGRRWAWRWRRRRMRPTPRMPMRLYRRARIGLGRM